MFREKRGALFNRYSKSSLSSTLRRVILGIVLVVILSFVVSTYVITTRENRDYNRRESESVINILSNNITSEMDKYRSISRLLMTDVDTLKFLRSDVDHIDIGMINDSRYSIMDILNVTEGVDTVMIIRNDLIMVTTNRFTYRYDLELMGEYGWRADIYKALGESVVSLNSYGVAKKSEDKPVVTIGRAIYDVDSQERTGILLMNIAPVIFERMLNRLGYNNICILGEDGSFIAGNREYAGYYSEEFSGITVGYKDVREGRRQMLASGAKIDGLPLIILRVSPYGAGGIPLRMLIVLLSLLVIFIVMAVYIATFVRKHITEPISEISSFMDRNRSSGRLDRMDVVAPNRELEQLENDYNSMIDYVHELMEKLVDKEKTLQKAEMRVLQEQIKPHFLYNSIDTIGYMALDAGADKVHGALETLGSFYRNFLSKGEREIPLQREVMIVKDYLSIQKLRYGDILDDEYDIEKGTENHIVPKLVLQPLVENCIYHGIRPKGEKGLITIKSKTEDGALHLFVRDTGVGMSEELIGKLLDPVRRDEGDLDSESFGLWGTIERVRYYTGRDDIVRIRSEIGEFTEIEFIIEKSEDIRR